MFIIQLTSTQNKKHGNLPDVFVFCCSFLQYATNPPGQVNFEIPYLANQGDRDICCKEDFPPQKMELPEELTIVHGSTLEVVRQKLRGE